MRPVWGLDGGGRFVEKKHERERERERERGGRLCVKFRQQLTRLVKTRLVKLMSASWHLRAAAWLNRFVQRTHADMFWFLKSVHTNCTFHASISSAILQQLLIFIFTFAQPNLLVNSRIFTNSEGQKVANITYDVCHAYVYRYAKFESRSLKSVRYILQVKMCPLWLRCGQGCRKNSAQPATMHWIRPKVHYFKCINNSLQLKHVFSTAVCELWKTMCAQCLSL